MEWLASPDSLVCDLFNSVVEAPVRLLHQLLHQLLLLSPAVSLPPDLLEAGLSEPGLDVDIGDQGLHGVVAQAGRLYPGFLGQTLQNLLSPGLAVKHGVEIDFVLLESDKHCSSGVQTSV